MFDKFKKHFDKNLKYYFLFPAIGILIMLLNSVYTSDMV